MDDLTEVRTAPPPRPEVLCKRLARRLAPTAGFVAYGILYAVVVANTVMLGALLGSTYLLSEVLGCGPANGALAIAVFVSSLLATAASWFPFAWWARRKRSALRSLVRLGALLDAQVTHLTHVTFRGNPITSTRMDLPLESGPRSVVLRSAGRLEHLEVGATLPVLYHPDSRIFAAFPLGKAVAGRLG